MVRHFCPHRRTIPARQQADQHHPSGSKVTGRFRESAASYRELSLLSDAELRKRGLARETIARFAVLGRAN